MHKKIVIMISISLLLLGVNFAEFGSLNLQYGYLYIFDSKFRKIHQYRRSMIRPIDFYGLVIDQSRTPISDVQVRLSIRSLSRDKIKLIKTDERGMFELKNETGSMIYIYTIEKKGYEFLGNQEKGFTYGADLEKNRFKPDQNNPVIFHMRKKEPPTLVIPGNFGKKLELDEIEYEVDLIKARGPHKRGYLGRYDKGEHTDLLIKANAGDNRSYYTVTFTAPDKDSGIVVSDELSYTAPEVGYQPRQTIKLAASERIKKHLYVKGRSGGLYSRLDIDVSAGEKGVYSEMKSWTNPNGLRNVDYDPDIYIEHVRRENEEQKRRNIEREEKKVKNKK